MALTREDVAKVALLARLRIEADELERLTNQLNTIVDFVAQLQEPDTQNVEPLAHGHDLKNVFRDDQAKPALSPDEALANAPKRLGDNFLVPLVLD